MRTCSSMRPVMIALATACVPAGAFANEPVLKRADSRDWILSVKVDAQSTPVRRFINDGKTPGFRVSTAFEIDSAAFIYPVLESTAAHETHHEQSTSSLSVDGVEFDDSVTLLPGYQSGERLGRWELPSVRGNLMRFTLDLPMTCYDVEFDEDRAMRIPWPTNPWPPVAASALQPQLFVESDDKVVRDMVRRWTNNNPGAVPPARLAKILCARVMENFRTTTDFGYVRERQGELAGLNVRGAAHAARVREGTPFDLTVLLCAAYRAAGLPARVVIGFDLAASLGAQLGIRDDEPVCEHNQRQNHGAAQPIVRAWVEFYLYDEAAQRAEWIPVDIYRQFRISHRPPPLDRSWDFFGNHPCLKHIAPISFHFHPPTTVVNAGPPAIWGWLPLPAAPALDQRLDFEAREPTTRGDDRD